MAGFWRAPCFAYRRLPSSYVVTWWRERTHSLVRVELSKKWKQQQITVARFFPTSIKAAYLSLLVFFLGTVRSLLSLKRSWSGHKGFAFLTSSNPNDCHAPSPRSITWRGRCWGFNIWILERHRHSIYNKNCDGVRMMLGQGSRRIQILLWFNLPLNLGNKGKAR